MPVPHAAVFAGLLAGSGELLDRARSALEAEWGKLALWTAPRAWTESGYYEAQMGPGLQRQFLAFERTVPMDALAALKRRAIELEETFKAGAAVARPVNIDPGLLDAHGLALASTKRAGHRICLADGLWAEITVIYRDGGYQPLPWTYPDFRKPGTLEFLGACRRLFLPRLK